jgi:hypothetical protein
MMQIMNNEARMIKAFMMPMRIPMRMSLSSGAGCAGRDECC